MRDNSVVLGIDIGGSHATAALVNLQTCTLLTGSRARREINSQGTVAEIMDDWCVVVENAIKGSREFSGRVGIAMPGPFDYPAGISLIQGQNKYDMLYKLNVKELLAERLLIAPEHIRFMNDAECFLQGEVVCGAAKGYQSAVGLTLGTGFGSSIYQNGRAKDAELWCAPFKGGIAEDLLSTRWFVKRYFELTGHEVKGVKELAALAAEDSKVQEVFDEFGQNMALFLGALIEQEKPEVVVIGGNISKTYRLFSSTLLACLQEDGSSTPIRIAELGEESALVGAAATWIKTRQEEVETEVQEG
ncbi:glucokinase [Pontibacter ummariensis]|uniref:Glucokinase n=1 Tax=Pontibacter ummariensis TaxID=1610492 RepID=A0A239G600_9BACT|nr:ROK family protein [Pontibacter ummariensis]PRY11661.1 glucokinase [Pontibacter ummariensis]SNS63464.1 glucokinase [Pontibacter ummariensis]